MVLKRKGVCRIFNLFRLWLIAGIVASFSLSAWSYAYAGDVKISRESIDLLTKIDQATAEIVEAVRPTVVNISTTRTVKVQGARTLSLKIRSSKSSSETSSERPKNANPSALDQVLSLTRKDLS